MITPRVFACALAALACALVGAAPAHAAVALAPLQGSADANARRALDDEVRASLELRKAPLQSARGTADAIATVRALGTTCDLAEASCLARIGAVAAVDRVMGGSFDGRRLTLHLVDVGSRKVVYSSLVDLSDPATRADQIELAVIRAYDPALEVGYLEISVNRSDASVVIRNEAKREQTTFPTPVPRLSLRPGKYRVYATAPGTLSFEEPLTVAVQRTVQLDIVLVDEAGARPPLVVNAPADDAPEEHEPLEARQLRVVVFRFASDDGALGANATAALIHELRLREGLDVLDEAALRDQLMKDEPDASSDPIGRCGAQQTCLMRLAARAQVDEAVFGAVHVRSDTREFDVESWDVHDETMQRPASRATVARELTVVSSLLADQLYPRVLFPARAPVRAKREGGFFVPPVVLLAGVGVAGAGLIGFAIGGAAWLALPENDDELRPFAAGLAIGGAAVALAGAVFSATLLSFVKWDDEPTDGAPKP